MRAAPCSRSAGFTLVEVLVGTTLLALMVSLLMSSFFTLGRGTRAGEERFDVLDGRRLVQAFLREQLGGAVPLTESAGRSERVLFEGRPREVLFVGHLPAHRGGGGLQYVRIGAESAFGPERLVLEYRNAWSALEFPPPEPSGGWQSTELGRDLASIRFRFYGREDDESPARWTDHWIDRDRLPALIELEVASADGTAWPALAVLVRTPTAAGQPQLLRAGTER